MKLASMDSTQMHAKSHHGYLLTAVRHECYSVMKRRHRRRDVDLSDPSLLQVADGSMNNTDDDLRQNIEQAFRELPIEQREVVHLKIYDQMTFNQIAEATGLSINTVASRYRYALEKLQRLLPEFGEAHER